MMQQFVTAGAKPGDQADLLCIVRIDTNADPVSENS